MNTTAQAVNVCGSGADTMKHTPHGSHNSGGNSSQQQARDEDKTLIQACNMQERQLNAVIISASAISLSIFWRVINNIQNLEVAHHTNYFYQGLYTTVWSSVPQAPVPSNLSKPYPYSALESLPTRIIRMNLYWITGLVFSLATVFLAVFTRQRIRNLKFRLIRRGLEHPLKSARNYEDHYVSPVIDTIYRLFQVALVVFFLGHVDIMVLPVGVFFFSWVVACGIFYVFRIIGPTY